MLRFLWICCASSHQRKVITEKVYRKVSRLGSSFTKKTVLRGIGTVETTTMGSRKPEKSSFLPFHSYREVCSETRSCVYWCMWGSHWCNCHSKNRGSRWYYLHQGFIVRKEKVAPKKVVTISRLEFCPAVFGIEISQPIQDQFDFDPQKHSIPYRQ